jgi:hypothetical protein
VRRTYAALALALCAACRETQAAPEVTPVAAEPAPPPASIVPAPVPVPAASSAAPEAESLPALSASVAAAPAAPPPPDPRRKGTLVLHFGDSFTEASFEQNLRAPIHATGARYWVKAKTPSYTPGWAFSDELLGLLGGRPQLVIITLGANELELPNPDRGAFAVKQLVKRVSQNGAACVWVTPPLWKKDTGFMKVIGENCAPCLFFDSDKYVKDVERQRDKIHPNEVGGARWAKAFWEWLEAHRDPERGPWALKPDP